MTSIQNKALSVTYTRGKDLNGGLEGAGGIGGLLARSHGYSSGTWSTHSYYHADALGNVSYLINSGQSMVASYKYDPYGRTLSSSGTLASANVMRFSSKLAMDASSMGLYYYGYRFYEPNLQRWINRDPLGERGGFNLYGYVLNQPTSLIDPLGLIRWRQVGAGALAIGGGIAGIMLIPVAAPVAAIGLGIAGATSLALGMTAVAAGAAEVGPCNIPTGVGSLVGYMSDRAHDPTLSPEDIGVGQYAGTIGDWAASGARAGASWNNYYGWIGRARFELDL